MKKTSLALLAGLFFIFTSAWAQEGGAIALDDGTPIRLRTTESISSANAHVDDHVNFQVVDDVKVGSVVVIRQGTIAMGTVTEAQEKRRMGRGGKLTINIDSTKTTAGDKVALRGIKDSKGGGHVGAMTGAMVGTAIVFWPAAPFFLFMHGKDITIPKGHEFTVYTSGAVTLEANKLAATGPGAATAGVTPGADESTVSVISTPPGADITVDEVFIGSTPSSVPMSPGDHRITISKTGYDKWERTIRITRGAISVNADLSRR